MTSASPSSTDDYVLGRNISSRIRLNQQHFMYPKIFGYLLHPAIPRDSPTLKVADVGTGTGIWLLDIAPTLAPSAELHGFDVDLSQLPPREWLPKNMKFDILDVMQDLPSHLEGQYDVVNVRLFLLVVKGDDPTPLLHKFARMLKPGGWLQWTDADRVTAYHDFVRPEQASSSGAAMKALDDKIVPRDARFTGAWALRLDEYFGAAGFSSVHKDLKRPQDFLPWLAFANDIVTTVYAELIEKMPQGQARDEMQAMYSKAARESWEGCAWNAPRFNVIGQKQ